MDNIFTALFFAIAYLYDEVILNIITTHTLNVGFVVCVVLLSFIIFNIIFILSNIVPSEFLKKIVIFILLFFTQIFFAVSVCVYKVFNNFFSIPYMAYMARDVVDNYPNDVKATIFSNIFYIVIFILPIILYLILSLNSSFSRHEKSYRVNKGLYTFISFIFEILAIGAFIFFFRYKVGNFELTSGIKTFGLYPASIVNMGKDKIKDMTSTELKSPKNMGSIYKKYSENTHNMINFDFDDMYANDMNRNTMTIHEAVKGIEPTKKNEYTGIFKDKLLIQITAESFSPVFINKELTPALYKLVNNSFVFDNFYAPDYTQSTIGGEFANLTGQIPEWFNGSITSAMMGMHHSFPFTFTNMVRNNTNNTVAAYHGNTYNYYDRDVLYDAFGFNEYIADGTGLEKIEPKPQTLQVSMDSGFMDNVFEDFIKEQKANMEKNKPFKHMYFMSYSGHMPYTFLSPIANGNRGFVERFFPTVSEEALSYVACQYDFEKAMEKMLDILEKNKMMDKVVICISTDHYPYALTQKKEGDAYKELAGFDFESGDAEYFKSALVIYNKNIKETHIDTPCASVDILPTLLNLFGYQYDSRLMIGRDILDSSYKEDIFSNNIPIVIFPNLPNNEYISIEDLAKNSDERKKLHEHIKELIQFRKDLSFNMQLYDYYGVLDKNMIYQKTQDKK